MAIELRQGTAATVKVGPFVDKDDGVTPETGLAGTMAVRVSKNGAAFAARNSGTSITHDENGYYTVALSSTDTNTLGRLKLAVTSAGVHVPVFEDIMVVAQQFWGSKYGSDLLQVDVREMAGNDSIPGDIVANIGNLDSPISALQDLSPADVEAALEQVIGVDTSAELAAVPAANAPLRDKVEWMFMLARNKRTASSLVETVNNDAGAAIATADISDSGSVTTRGKYS